MSRPLAAALINQSAITALIGDRHALKQLPAGTEMPALVYSVIDVNPHDYTDGDGYEAMRLQINPLAPTVKQVQQIHDAVRSTLHGLAQITLAGKRVITVFKDAVGPEDVTDDGDGHIVWTWPRDYIVLYE